MEFLENCVKIFAVFILEGKRLLILQDRCPRKGTAMNLGLIFHRIERKANSYHFSDQ